MTDVMGKVDEFEAVVVGVAHAKQVKKQSKDQSGEVVRQVALSRIQLGKRRGRTDDDNDEKKKKVLPQSSCANQVADRDLRISWLC